jgi:hypothetical protein
MRPSRPMDALRKVLSAVALALVALPLAATAVTAQTRIDPTDEIERNDGGWIFWLAIGIAAAALALVVFLVIMYMRYAPRFARDDDAKAVHADRVRPGHETPRRAVDLSQAVPIVAQPPALPSAVAAVATAPAPAAPPALAAEAPAAPSAAPAPAEAPPAAPPAAPAEAAAPPAPVAPPAPAERVEVTMDQEVFDAKLAELLAAGTDRRVAEGQARRAGMIAARKKATGEG